MTWSRPATEKSMSMSGRVFSSGIQEPLEEEAVANRIDVRDLQAVGGERSRRGPTAGADADPVLLREVDEVPDDEEVVGEAHSREPSSTRSASARGARASRCRTAWPGPSHTARRGSRRRRDRALGTSGAGSCRGRSPRSTVPRPRSVRASASSCPAKSAAISSGVLKKNSLVSNRQCAGFFSVSPDWM